MVKEVKQKTIEELSFLKKRREERIRKKFKKLKNEKKNDI